MPRPWQLQSLMCSCRQQENCASGYLNKCMAAACALWCTPCADSRRPSSFQLSRLPPRPLPTPPSPVLDPPSRRLLPLQSPYLRKPATSAACLSTHSRAWGLAVRAQCCSQGCMRTEREAPHPRSESVCPVYTPPLHSLPSLPCLQVAAPSLRIPMPP